MERGILGSHHMTSGGLLQRAQDKANALRLANALLNDQSAKTVAAVIADLKRHHVPETKKIIQSLEQMVGKPEMIKQFATAILQKFG